jgi:SHS2 domain-containing protein
MNRSYQLLDHTADLRIRVTGSDQAELFENAGLALFDLICDSAPQASTDTARLVVTGDDPADLMVNYLRELLYLWTGGDKLAKMIHIEAISDTRLKARVTTGPFLPESEAIAHEIKAVTYHQIEVAPTSAGWQATVVFDI